MKTLEKPQLVDRHAPPERLIQVRRSRLLCVGARPGKDDDFGRHRAQESGACNDDGHDFRDSPRVALHNVALHIPYHTLLPEAMG
jgi:hypothetical protein